MQIYEFDAYLTVYLSYAEHDLQRSNFLDYSPPSNGMGLAQVSNHKGILISQRRQTSS